MLRDLMLGSERLFCIVSEILLWELRSAVVFLW